MTDDHAQPTVDAQDALSPMREFRDDFEAQFERIHKRFDEVLESCVSLRELMDRRFDAMERRQAADMAELRQMLADAGWGERPEAS